MKELGGKVDGHRHIPILYDVLVHESVYNKINGRMFNRKKETIVFIVMEYF